MHTSQHLSLEHAADCFLSVEHRFFSLHRSYTENLPVCNILRQVIYQCSQLSVQCTIYIHDLAPRGFTGKGDCPSVQWSWKFYMHFVSHTKNTQCLYSIQLFSIVIENYLCTNMRKITLTALMEIQHLTQVRITIFATVLVSTRCPRKK